MGQRNKRQRIQTMPPESHSDPSTAHVSSVLASAVAALQTSDPNSTFSDHLLAELRTPLDSESRDLRRFLSRDV